MTTQVGNSSQPNGNSELAHWKFLFLLHNILYSAIFLS